MRSEPTILQSSAHIFHPCWWPYVISVCRSSSSLSCSQTPSTLRCPRNCCLQNRRKNATQGLSLERWWLWRFKTWRMEPLTTGPWRNSSKLQAANQPVKYSFANRSLLVLFQLLFGIISEDYKCFSGWYLLQNICMAPHKTHVRVEINSLGTKEFCHSKNSVCFSRGQSHDRIAT